MFASVKQLNCGIVKFKQFLEVELLHSVDGWNSYRLIENGVRFRNRQNFSNPLTLIYNCVLIKEQICRIVMSDVGVMALEILHGQFFIRRPNIMYGTKVKSVPLVLLEICYFRYLLSYCIVV